MKPIRNYSDGQWLLLLWGFVLLFLFTGAFLSKLVLIVAILGAIGAAYTTFLYLRANDFTLPFLPSRPAENDQDEDDDEYDDAVYDDEYDDNHYGDGEDEPVGPAGPRTAPVVDSFERPAHPSDAQRQFDSQQQHNLEGQHDPQRSDAPTSPDLSEGDPR